MIRCPGCGAETDPQMKTCWECHEPLDTSHSHKEDQEFGLEDEDDDLLQPSRNGNEELTITDEASESTKRPAARLDHAADALLEAADSPAVEIPATAVVAYVAQDEVQAGTISQLLSDCGIHNFATSQSDTGDNKDSEELLQVQVLKEDLAAAQQLIEDFTSEFDDFT